MGIAKALAAKNGYELDSNQEVLIDLISTLLVIDAFSNFIKDKGE